MMRITSGLAWLAVLLALAVWVLLVAMGGMSVLRLGSDYHETNRYEATFLFFQMSFLT
jgi:DMSO/TMAO reductase YedYZ heme-binding membrane subunit